MPEHDVLSHKVNNLAKTSNFGILLKTQHATHFLKSVDKMCKYEMDPASVVEVTEQTLFHLQTVGQIDGQRMWNQYTPTTFLAEGTKTYYDTLKIY